jgi:hypothetical protein
VRSRAFAGRLWLGGSAAIAAAPAARPLGIGFAAWLGRLCAEALRLERDERAFRLNGPWSLRRVFSRRDRLAFSAPGADSRAATAPSRRLR